MMTDFPPDLLRESNSHARPLLKEIKIHLQNTSTTVSSSCPIVMETGRYPFSVRLAGVLHKGKNKMYITSVLWSDQNEVVVYRSLLDFQQMHKQLKKAFPPASKLNKSDRVLPKFRGIKLKPKKQGKEPNKSLVHLKYLQKYCDELLSCDPRVSHSADLIRFFHATEEELRPEFTKNSIMIMPSEDEIRTNGGQINSGNVTQPFVTETYRCVAPYETKDTKNKPFKVAADDKIDVLIKDKGGWWLVETEDKRMAWFPAPYLEKVEDDDEDEMDGIPDRGTLYMAVKSYKSTKFDEISVNTGTVVEVLQKSENGWWLVRYNGKIGYIPALCLQPYSFPRICLTPQNQESNNPSSLLAPSPSPHHRCSHGDLPQLPLVPSSSPNQSKSIIRSQSLNRISDQPDPLSAGGPTNPNPNPRPKPIPAVRVRPPVITVQAHDEKEKEEQSSKAPTTYTYDSADSDSFSNDEADSLFDSTSSFNLSYSYNDDRLRRSSTPTPTGNTFLTPSSHSQGQLPPSVSDPNLYKRPASPKVPPRPRAQEILTRCTTLTRNNAAKTTQSPTQTEVTSR